MPRAIESGRKPVDLPAARKFVGDTFGVERTSGVDMASGVSERRRQTAKKVLWPIQNKRGFSLEKTIDTVRSRAANSRTDRAKRLGLNNIANRYGYKPDTASAIPPNKRDYDGWFGKPTSVDSLLTQVMKNSESRKEWLRSIDQDAKDSTQRNITEQLDAFKKGKPVRKNIVVVGGGPTSLVATRLLRSFGYDVLVITDKKALGYPMRARPYALNTSSEYEALSGPRFPFLKRGTTPIAPEGFLNAIQPGDLTSDDNSIHIDCSDGSKRDYIYGSVYGETIASEFATSTDDFMVGTQVSWEQTAQLSQNMPSSEGVRLVLNLKFPYQRGPDVRTVLDADAVLAFPGPLENVDNRNPKSRNFLLDEFDRFEREKNLINTLEYKMDINATEKTAFINKLTQQLANFKLRLPRVMTPDMVESTIEFWQQELGADPERWPFREMYENGKTVGVIGGKDGANVATEFALGLCDPSYYPEDIKGKYPKIFRYGISREGFDKSRSRYSERYNPDTYDIRFNPKQLNDIYEDDEKTEFYLQDKYDGYQAGENHDYTFLALGYRPSKAVEKLKNLLRLSPIYDGERSTYQYDPSVIGYGNRENIFFGGSSVNALAAVKEKRNDYIPDVESRFSGPTKGTIDYLKLNENLLSLFAQVPLVEYLTYHVIDKLPPSQDKLILEYLKSLIN